MVDSQQNSQQQLDSQQHELQITDAQQQEGAAQKISVEQQEGVQKDNMISAAEAFQKLKDSDVKRYNYSSFKDNKFLGEGAFADVFSATFENKQYALKHMKNKDLDDEMFKTVTRELQILHKVNHTNVIKFYGISEDPQTKRFVMVLQLANGGNLRDYLKNKCSNGIFKIAWVDIIRIATDITLGLNHLHIKDIIHRDLHSKNVLINNDNNDRALIADFGLSKQLDEASSVSLNLRGMLGYIEPQCFINTATKRDKKSDIYSLGVLFWELTSGIPPFTKSDVAKDKFAMFTEIGKGLRETPIDDTPQQYKELYTECWSTDPNQRPALARILDDLTGMSETDVEFITNIVPENKRTQTFSSLFSDTKLIHELWQIFLKSTNRGNEFRQISKMIKDCIEKHQKTSNDVFNDLQNQTNDLNAQCLLGFFYFTGIGTEEQHNKAFEIFQQVANEDNPIGQFYLGECFRCGYGTKKDPKSANNWHQKANDKCPRSTNALGLCYLNGKGVKKDKQVAFKYFKESHEKGCISACNNLGNCYELGIIEEKDKIKAFEHYKIAADEDIPFGQCNLARCYKNGIGTEKNLDLAKTWYQKASDNGHKDAEKQLAQLSSKTKGIGLTSFFKAKENNIQSDGNNH